MAHGQKPASQHPDPPALSRTGMGVAETGGSRYKNGNALDADYPMKKIAVVEDNPDNRLLVQVILEPLYEVVEYENGFAALEGLPQAMPDLVLLDISLPEMDGTEVLRRIRADERLRALPVIALTAHAMAGDREKYIAAGFDEYVTKPIVDETLLLDAIERLLAGKAGS
jgi:CheY-like chemotaxis protein